MTAQSNPISLQYSAPHALFAGEYHYRNGRTFVMALVAIGLAIVLTLATAYSSNQPGSSARVLPAILLVILFLLVAGYLLHSYFSGRVDPIVINDEGIMFRRAFDPWANICRFEGITDKNGNVVIRYCIGMPNSYYAKLVSNTPPLGIEQFAELTAMLIERVGVRQPTLEIVATPDSRKNDRLV